MAKAGAGDKCVEATAAMRATALPLSPCGRRVRGSGLSIDRNPSPAFDASHLRHPLPQGERARHHFGLSAAAFLHSDMNFLRSLPWTPLVSASFEHSSEAAVRGFSAFFSAGAAFGAGAVFAAGAGGVIAWANAELMSSRDATAVAAA